MRSNAHMCSTHEGKIVAEAVRQSGFSVTKLARMLRISRAAFYKRLRSPKLSKHFVLSVSQITGCDLSSLFSEVDGCSELYVQTALKMQGNYIGILEQYIRLLLFAFRVLEKSERPFVRQQMVDFIKQQSLYQFDKKKP